MQEEQRKQYYLYLCLFVAFCCTSLLPSMVASQKTTIMQTLMPTTSARVATTTTTTANSGLCTDCCSYNPVSRQRSIMQTVDTAFSTQRQMDVVFVVKNSQGFGADRLEQVRTFIGNLLSYLQQRGFVIVHPDNTRISIFTFADNAITIMNGISDTSGKYDACQLFGYINNSITLNSRTSSSDPFSALTKAQQAFDSDGSRSATKILFHFDNGADWSQANGGAIAALVNSLNTMGVHRFAAGTGLPPNGWMNTVQLEANVQSIASDLDNYYACMDDWTQAITNALATVHNTGPSAGGELYTYSSLGSSYCDAMNCSTSASDRSCPACISPSPPLCACGAIARSFSCQACSSLFACSSTVPTVSASTGSSTSKTTHRPSDDNLSELPISTSILIIIVVFSAVAAIVIVVTIVVVSMCCCECCDCRDKCVSHPSPKPPPARQSLESHGGNFDDANGHLDNVFNITVENGRQPRVNNVVRSEPPADHLQMRERNTDNQDRFNNEAIYRGTGRDLEKNMEDWPEYLTSNALCLIHLCVVGISGRRWAQSNSGWFVKTREACVIDDLLTTVNASDGPSGAGRRRNNYTDSPGTNNARVKPFKIAGVSFVIDNRDNNASKIKNLELLYARRIGDGSEQNDIAIASRANNFVVIGVCAKGREQMCLDVIREIVQYLIQDGIEDLPADEGIYGRIVRVRRSVSRRS